MKRYREFMSRGECLINALLSGVILVLQMAVLWPLWADLDGLDRTLMVLLLLLELGSCAFHCCRYLTYNKK